MELEKVLFVIVLYNQPLESSNAFQSLEPVLARDNKISIFVYDNSPTKSRGPLPCSSYVHDPSNPGVSYAYNRAYSYARQNQFRFLLLMDQDSSFPEATLLSYSQAVATHPTLHVFAPTARDRERHYSPFKTINGRGVALTLAPGIHSLKNITVINSGLLISLEAFYKTGGYDERFPLDFSDIDFCERLASHAFDLCLIDASIFHRHSSSEKHESRARFDTYLHAVVLFKKISNRKVSYWLTGFPRAAKLFVRTGDRWFLHRFFKLRA